MAERIRWSTEARTDIRAIDRDTALRLLKGLDRFLKTGVGDVKQLEGFEPPLFRLRVGVWRLIYRPASGDVIEVVRVRHTAKRLTADSKVWLGTPVRALNFATSVLLLGTKARFVHVRRLGRDEAWHLAVGKRRWR